MDAQGLKVISTHDADDTLIRDGRDSRCWSATCGSTPTTWTTRTTGRRFLERWFDNVANWAFAAAQLAAANGQGAVWTYPDPA